MEWFGGDVVSAVRTVKEQSKLLMVFIKGSDESSLLVDRLLDEDVMRVCHGILVLFMGFVMLALFEGLRLDANSEAAAQFSAVYALLSVPCIYLIAPSGKVVDAKLGSMDKQELILWISNQINRSGGTEPQPFVSSNDSQPSTSCHLPNSTEDYPARDICPSSINPSADVASAKTVQPNDPPGLQDCVSRAYQLIEEKRRKKLEEEKSNAVNDELKRRESGKTLREFKIRLQLRLMDGGHVVGRFEPNATLTCELRNWIQNLVQNNPDGTMELPAVDETLRVKLAALVSRGYRFRQLHPSKLFSPEDETRTMADLDLSPSAVLILVPSTPGAQSAVQPVNHGMASRAFFLLNSSLQTFYSYIGWIFNGIYSVGSGLVSSLIPSQPGNRPAQSAAPDSPRSSSTSKSSTTRENRAVRRQGNMARLSHLPDNSDDEQARWNGNSTEQL
ncbi:hypothetical protein AHF37_03985 [Paragonimus kellicotti]|nr:hypothetical protein AHF37_03985 [Paragonimus kellicotti]